MPSRSYSPLICAAVALCLGVSACGAGSRSASGTTTTQAAASTTLPGASTSTTSTTSPSSTSPTLGTAENVVITDAIRAQLVAAGAASHSLTSADYTGLQPGMTYYAFDPATQTYWAGASLVPSPSSEQAQVSSQDDGAYLLFHEPVGGPWTAINVGLAGFDGSTCPYTPPAAILQLWGWPANSCRPANI